MAAAAVSTTLGTLPVFLLGGLAVLVRADLGFSETQLGAAATVFFASSACCGVLAGRTSERFGPTAATISAALVSALVLVGTATVGNYAALLALLVAGGAANAFSQLGSNLALARAVPEDRQGLAFAVKQSAIPIATLLGGLAVPLVGLTVGWRWGFAGGAGIALAYPLLVRRGAGPPAAHRRAPGTPLRQGDAAAGPLVVIALGGALGAAATNAFGAFLVEGAVVSGLGPGAAGSLLALGSAVGIAARLAVGVLADRRDGGHLPVVAAQCAIGAAGMALLAVPAPAALVAGTLLAFGFGWSWPGLLTFAIVRLNPGAPAAATGITQTGVFAGGALGPLVFGATVEASGYPVAWSCAAAALLAGAAFVLLGRQLLTADLAARRAAQEAA